MKWAAIIGVFGVLLSGADAGERTSPGSKWNDFWQSCSTIQTQTEREDCFQKVELLARLQKQIEGKPAGGEWRYYESTNEFTDAESLTIFVKSTADVYVRLHDVVRPSLVIRCEARNTSLYFVFGTSVAARDTQLHIRIDKNPAEYLTTSASTDYETVGLWSGRTAIPFGKKLFGAQKLLIEILPVGGGPVSATFNISEVAAAIHPLRQKCGW